MPAITVELGENGLVDIGRVDSNLTVRSGSYGEARFESSDDRFDVVPIEGGLRVERVTSNLTVRLPEGARLRVEDVRGNLRLKDVPGSVEIGRVRGGCSIRRVGTLHVDRVDGDLRVRDGGGEVAISRVSGNLMLNDIVGLVSAETVYGNMLADDVPSGVQVTDVRGRLALRTAFHPGSEYHMESRGPATIKVPEDASVAITVDARDGVRTDAGIDEQSREGGKRVYVLGEGSASVIVITRGHAKISRWSPYGDDEYSPAFDDLNEHIEASFAHIDARFEDVQHRLHDLPDRIRGKVERKLESARRKVEAAQERAERAVESALNDADAGHVGFTLGLDLGDFKSRRYPVTDEERMKILDMLENGQITVQDAEMLLAALEGRAS